jgi:hypothetical protein
MKYTGGRLEPAVLAMKAVNRLRVVVAKCRAFGPRPVTG